jgi:hypothetical protein
LNIPSPLIDDIAAGKCLPFIGAGFSLNAKLPDKYKMPDWPGLTRILSQATGAPRKAGGPEVASIFERRFGRVQLIEAIRKALHSDLVEPGKAHRAFAQLPFDTVYTTNFDLLLEEANGLLKRPYRSLVGELQMPFHGGPLTTNIVKMHGDLRHEEHIIVTQEDYADFLDRYPVVSTHLSAMLITRTAIFIGYSLLDPDFNHIRDVVRSRLGKFQRMAYIIQFDQPETKIDKMLDDNLHVVNFNVKKKESIDDVLAEFFDTIQEELDARAGKRLRAAKPEVFEEMDTKTLEAVSRAPDSTALLSSSSNLCFVLMPFGEPFDRIYRSLIQPAILTSGLEAMRADQISYPGAIMEQIRAAIQQSRLCVADLSGRNPNVLYELGIAQTLGKPTIMLAQEVEDIPFDLRHYRAIIYGKSLDRLESARRRLIESVQAVLGLDRLDEARQLIRTGMVRAGVALLGILLEHSLRHLIVTHNVSDGRTFGQLSRPLTMGLMLDLLVRSEIINRKEASSLKSAISLRNKAVHELTEPSIQEADELFHTVESFVRKHIGNTEPGDPQDRQETAPASR